jgi:hypothetical protein
METMLNKVSSEVGEENPKIPQLQPLQALKIIQVPGHNMEVPATEEALREEEGIFPTQKG